MPRQPFLPSDILPNFPRPLVFAHRGLSSLAPENTMAAFIMARDRGIPGIELDVWPCLSGEIVVTHESLTGRLSKTNMDVTLSSLAEIKEIDIGSHKGKEFSGERIPLLREVFEKLGTDLYFDVEIKTPDAVDRGLERALSSLIDEFSLTNRVIVSSFNPFSIARFKRLQPGIKTGIIYEDKPYLPWYLRNGQGRWPGEADFLKPHYKKITPAGVFFNGALGWKTMLPWTVDDPALARRCLDLGCVGLISNRPHELNILQKSTE